MRITCAFVLGLVVASCGPPAKPSPEQSARARLVVRNAIEPSCIGQTQCTPRAEQVASCVIDRANGADVISISASNPNGNNFILAKSLTSQPRMRSCLSNRERADLDARI